MFNSFHRCGGVSGGGGVGLGVGVGHGRFQQEQRANASSRGRDWLVRAFTLGCVCVHAVCLSS